MRQLSTFVGLALVSVLAVACGGAKDKSDGDEDMGSVQNALEDENGGMDEGDEKPAFGNPEVSSVPSFNPAMAEISDAPDAVGGRSYHVALLWGHLPAPQDATTTDVDPQPVDWTGSVSVDQGAIGVLRKLAFDKRDELARREDKAEVSFRSHTLPHVDGLYLRVVAPDPSTPHVLHFKTAALTTDIDLDALGKSIVDGKRLGDGRNGLLWIGFPDVADCHRGLLFGRWVKMRPNLGKLRGHVMNAEGDGIGHVKGIWGHAPKRDKNVFFGKYIGLEGHTRGLFGGTYGGGTGEGLWATREPRDVGGLQLAYSDGYEKGDGRGVWLGRWSERCAK